MLLVGLAILAIGAVAVGCGSVDGDKGGSTGAGDGKTTAGGEAAAGDGGAAGGANADGGGEGSGAGNGGEAGGGETGSGGEAGAAGSGEGVGGEAGGTGGGAASGAGGAKAAFIKQGDQICQSIPQKYTALLQKLPKAQQGNPLIAVPKAAVPALREAIEEFKAIAPAPGEEEKAEAIVAAMEKGAAGMEANPKAPLSGPESSLVEFSKLTGEYGLKTCSEL